MAQEDSLFPGDTVVLLTKPDGCTSKDLPLTVGREYTFRYYVGSCVCITTDQPGLDGHIWRGRVQKVVPAQA